MKKILFLLMAMACFAISFGQQKYTKGKALGISLIMNDFKAASDIRSKGLVRVLDNKDFFKTDNMKPGLAVHYLSGLSNHMDFISTLSGSFLQYPIEGVTAGGGDKFLLDLTAAINFKLLSDHYWVTPYVDLGVGGSRYGSKMAAFIPAGLGLQVNLIDQAFLLINSQYRIPVTQNASYHFYQSIGVAGAITEKKQPAPKEVEIPVVLDRDGDGIPDADDKCPDVPGVAKYGGCPIPDTDGDGINDEEDKCPNVPGVARYQGCPIPDTDGDGVNDEIDKCPNEAGPASNFGCPVIEKVVIEKINKAAENIFFTSGSAKLLEKSYKSLDEVVTILKENPSYKVSIEGHTDITGGEELNQKLSESRAASVKEYLSKNGVDESRITSAGYGLSNPIADNNTAAGRAKNRRVEMKITNH
ncbi:MAG: OmpA family protein [Ginsengibacter sp.]